MNPLDVAYASPGSEVLIPTIELSSQAWPEPQLICAGFENQTCGTEDGRTVTFIATGLDASLPNKDNSVSQSVTFAIDAVVGIAKEMITRSIESEAVIRLTLRLYLSTDLSLPAERPYYLIVRGGSMEGETVTVQAGYFSLIDINFNRETYNANTAPCIKYL